MPLFHYSSVSTAEIQPIDVADQFVDPSSASSKMLHAPFVDYVIVPTNVNCLWLMRDEMHALGQVVGHNL